MKKRDLVISTCFLLMIFVILIGSLIMIKMPKNTDADERISIEEANGTRQDGNKGSMDEKAIETKKYETNFNGLKACLTDFTDDLFLKGAFVNFNTGLSRVLTANTYLESTQVLLGKDNYLFYKTTSDGNPIYDYQGSNLYNAEELLAFAENLTKTRNYFEDNNIECYFIFMPNKEVVCEDYLPKTVVKVNDENKCQQLANFLSNNTDLKFIYPEEVLKKASKERQVFYKTDTHLNQVGSFICFQEIYDMAYGKKESVDDVVFNIPDEHYAGDLANLANLSKEYNIDTVYSLDPASCSKEMYQDKRIMVVGDSFSGFLSVIAKGYFSDVNWIYTSDFTMAMVEEYQPDVIIWETVMRYMDVFKDICLLEK